MPTYPLTTLAAQVTSEGISAPSYNDILASLVASFQSIYGSDAALGNDSQDYQLLAIIALAISDANQTAITVYNSYSPTYAQGAALSSEVAINGLQRDIPTNSTAPILLTGVIGTQIPAGVIQDANGYLWTLPLNLTIPEEGDMTVTGTCATEGAIAAPSGSINSIYVGAVGLQTAVNTSAATPGAPAETDAALRARQIISTSMPALTPLAAILAAVANVVGVQRYAIYENQGATTDSNGIPSHSIVVVAEGGDATAIATAIESKKSPGTGTGGGMSGITTVTVEDPSGVPIPISFYTLTGVSIYAAITITPLNGYSDTTGLAIVAALVNFINSLAIGEDVYLNWCIAEAGLANTPQQQTFVITSLTIGLSSGSLGTSDITIAFNDAAQCATANVILVVS